MPWISSYSGTPAMPNFLWDYITSTPPNRFRRDSASLTQSAQLTYKPTFYYKFKSNKTYIWKTYVTNFNSASQSGTRPIRNLGITPPYKVGATFSYKNRVSTLGFELPTAYTLPVSTPYVGSNETNNCLIFIDRPQTSALKDSQVIYSATFSGFDTSGIYYSKLLEIDWLIQGYAFATSSNSIRDNSYEGWRFDENDESFTFNHSTNTTNERRLPLSLAINTLSGSLNNVAQASQKAGSTSVKGVTYSNFICRYIDSPIFNMDVSVLFNGSSWIDCYLFDSQPPITTDISTFNNFLSTGQKVGRISSTGDYSFYNLQGGKYLTFISEYKNTNIDYKNTISNIKIIEGYSETDNNESFLVTNTNQYYDPINLSPIGISQYSTFSVVTTNSNTQHQAGSSFYGLTGATGSFPGFYTNLSASLINLSSINSKIGNARFKAGIWENGVWNSGLRIDENLFSFDDVQLAIKLSTRNVNWRIQIFGSTFSTSQFNIGDRIAISNIVAIDINEERKLLKNYFTIVNKGERTLIVEAENNFPIRRIEKDSENHKILITKNIWLNGGFLNGYFEGVWNDGLFRGYPYITEMYNSHWIDGTFNGGHFYSENPYAIFVDTYYYDGYVGLTFGATAHGFLPGDKIFINKFDNTVNASYNGSHTVTDVVDDYLLVTDVVWETSTNLEGGYVIRETNTGLVQKFRFYDNNVAPKTSQTSRNPKEIWRFNSWMDLVFRTQSSTNIGTNKTLYNSSSNNIDEVLQKHKFGFGDYTAMNLYGYVTDDVLSSESQFRDIDTFFKRNYSLGTKYQIYQDFLGDIGEFTNAFDSNPELGTMDNFYADGWTYSFSGILATYSYINRYVKKKSTNQILTTYDSNGTSYFSPTYIPNGGAPTWSNVSFNSLSEDSFGLLIQETVANEEFKVNTSGIYEIKVNIPANFYTKVQAPGISGIADNDYLYLNGNELVGQLNLLKWDAETDSSVVLVNKKIKTTGGDFNVGVEYFEQGQDICEYDTNITLTIDWKGQLKNGDKIKVAFQRCRTIIQSYNIGGPWRGSGFEQGFGFNDNITDVVAKWTFGTSTTISINNAGVDTSLGFNIKRTPDKTLQYESDKEISFFTLNNTNISMEKNRYSMIEFDIIQQPDSLLNIFSYGSQSFNLQFHTIDLYNFSNFINTDQTYGATFAYPAGYDPLIDPFEDYLSIYSNGIDYKYLGTNRVREFFYNRPGLDLGFWNFNTQFTDNTTTKLHELDNIKFYEVDMIPFFQYTTEDFVNKQIQVPLVGVAPVIDYSDENFNFVGGIILGLDAISLDSGGLVSSSSASIYISPSAAFDAATG